MGTILNIKTHPKHWKSSNMLHVLHSSFWKKWYSKRTFLNVPIAIQISFCFRGRRVYRSIEKLQLIQISYWSFLVANYLITMLGNFNFLGILNSLQWKKKKKKSHELMVQQNLLLQLKMDFTMGLKVFPSICNNAGNF